MPKEIVVALENTISILESRFKIINMYDEKLNVGEYINKLIKICRHIIDEDLITHVDEYFTVYDNFKSILNLPNRSVDVTLLENAKVDINNLFLKLDIKDVLDDKKEEVVKENSEQDEKPKLKTYELVNLFNNKAQDLHFLGDELVTSGVAFKSDHLKVISDVYADAYDLIKDFNSVIPNTKNLNGATIDNVSELPAEKNEIIKNVILSLDNLIKKIRLIFKKGLDNINEQDISTILDDYNNLKTIVLTYPDKKVNIEL